MRHALPSASHASHRAGLRILGLLLCAVGGVFLIVGLTSFFSGFDGGSPSRFWCVFVGLPSLGIGVGCLKLGYLGSITRYAANETAPVAADAIDYVARETRDAVRTTAAAVAEGLSGGGSASACPSCRAPQAAGASFCDRCGTNLSGAATCSKCRAPLRAKARFCQACGAAASA